METPIFSSIGTTTKKESLILNDRIDDSSALVFICEHPYSGYYGSTVPDKPEPQSMYLITDQNYDSDMIIRSIQAVKKHFDYDFDAVPGLISFLNKDFGMIRVQCVSYQHVPRLIRALRKENIGFMPMRNFPSFEGIVRVTKYFKTEEARPGIFLDIGNPNFAYLHIEKEIEWNVFEKIYRDVSNNITDFSFDAALAKMYNEKGILDFIRIYDEKRSVEKLEIIHNKFKDIIQKY
ncbi:MAG: hypothetical protein V2I34_01750 [Bacteroidales bacterium]|nr:hypothetical protein [Bacteroidales bacterium]